MLQLTIGYLNATITGKTQKAEPDIGTVGSSKTLENPPDYGYRYGFILPRGSGSGYWTGLGPNRTVIVAQTLTAGRSPGPIANTSFYSSLLTSLSFSLISLSYSTTLSSMCRQSTTDAFRLLKYSSTEYHPHLCVCVVYLPVVWARNNCTWPSWYYFSHRNIRSWGC